MSLLPKHFKVVDGRTRYIVSKVNASKLNSKGKVVQETVSVTEPISGKTYQFDMNFLRIHHTEMKGRDKYAINVANAFTNSIQSKERGMRYIPIDIVEDDVYNSNYVIDLQPFLVNKEKYMTTKPESVTLKFQSVVTATEGGLVPKINKLYVPFGVHEDIDRIIRTGMFLPAQIYGLSGTGKTLAVDQVCANLGRELIRVNITADTDEDDLIGHYELVDGQTVWHEGPVVEAMKRGAILLLDEFDLGTNRMMCLQPVLEGNRILVKKTGEYVDPKPGFNIISTANTKGKGDETGNFSGTNVLNEAMLDRFIALFEQDYAPKEVEMSILTKITANMIETPEDCDAIFASNLINWATSTRRAFKEDQYQDVITTRRLTNAMKLFFVYDRDEMKVIDMIVSRFDKATSEAMKAMYKQIRVPLFGPTVDASLNSKGYTRNSNGSFIFE